MTKNIASRLQRASNLLRKRAYWPKTADTINEAAALIIQLQFDLERAQIALKECEKSPPTRKGQ